MLATLIDRIPARQRRAFSVSFAICPLVIVVTLALFPATAEGGMNGDGDLDVVFGNDGENSVCLGDGSGGFTCHGVGGDALTTDVAAGDVDGDGNMDVVFANDHIDRVCLGDGFGGFTCGNLDAEDARTNAVALGDVNNDGNLDAVHSRRLAPNRLCLGDGSGAFSCRDLSTDTYPPYYTLDIAMAYVNGDDDLDVIVANDGPDRVCLGDGSGGFTCSDVGSDPIHSNEVALGDINMDGQIDAVFANAGGHNRVCLGDRFGGFVCNEMVGIDTGSIALALGDVNLDGNLDVVSRSFSETGYPSQVFLGDGSGGFEWNIVDRGDDYVGDGYDAEIGDIDGDGNPDAVFPTSWELPSRVCLGDGTGRFACRDLIDDTMRSYGFAVVTRGNATYPPIPPAPHLTGSFVDDDDSVFEADIEWMADAGITKGCNPPTNDRFCPNSNVTRGQMAAFLVRALDLTHRLDDPFTDDDGHTFEADIERMAAAGITKGCNPAEGNTKFCPDAKVTRGQMAAFLVRALKYTDNGGGDLFTDDDGSIFEADIDKLGTAGVTKGCNPSEGNTRFCPDSYVTRGQMAAFLHRALG